MQRRQKILRTGALLRERSIRLPVGVSNSREGDLAFQAYSERSASVGLTEAARRAGMKLASKADTARIRTTAAKVVKSQLCTQNSSDCRSVVAASEERRQGYRVCYRNWHG